MKKTVSLILSLLMLFNCVSLFACKEKEEEKISILSDGETNYAIYRADRATGAEKDAATSLRNMIKEKTGVFISYSTDDEYSKIEGKLEIVFGSTNREASSIAAQGLGENQIRFLAVDTTIAIVASNPECLPLAAQTFVDEYVTENKIEVPKNLDRTWQCVPQYDTYTVSNPINDEGDDPYVTQLNGTYYYCWSSGNGVSVSSAEAIDKISKEGAVKVYTAPGGTMYSGQYWAPELHYIDGQWYIYVAASDGEDRNHRMYVLQGTSQDPTKPFKFVGKISDPSDKWAIDGTVLKYNDELYFVWSGWQGDNDGGNQKLYIAHMSSPTEIDSDRVEISRPTQSWEGPLNEGPIALYNGDDVYIIFSGNGSWTADYCLGYLRLTGKDPMKKSSWTKNSYAILSRSNVAKGPGHCSVASAPDGSQWIIYHANLLMAEDGWNGRSVWIQRLSFTDDGRIKTMKSAKTVAMPFSSWAIEKEL